MDICNSVHIKSGTYISPPFEDPLGAVAAAKPIAPSPITLPFPQLSSERTQQLNLEMAALGVIEVWTSTTQVQQTPPESPIATEIKKSHIFDRRVVTTDPTDFQNPIRLQHHCEILDADDEEVSLRNIREFIQPPKNLSDQSFDTGQVHVLGLSNALFLPSNWIGYIRFLYKAIKTGDTEGIIEYAIKVFTVPFGIANAFENIFIGYITVKGINIGIFVLSSIIFGSIFLTIELCLEIARLVRTIQFRDAIQPAMALDLIKNLDTSKITKEKELRHFIDSLTLVRDSFSHFMSNSEAEKRVDSIIEVLKGPEELKQRISMASHKIEELKLRLLTSALSSIHETYLFLSEKEIEGCDARALKNADFNRDFSDFEGTDEEIMQNERKKFDRYMGNFATERALLLEGKRSALGRRVRLKMVNKLEKSLPTLFSTYRWYIENSPSQYTSGIDRLQAREIMICEATELLKNLDEQSEKTILVHVIGIAGILLGIGAFIASTVACPPAAVLLISLTGLVLQLYRGFAPEAYLDSDGYSWNWNALLPDFLKAQSGSAPGKFRSEKELQPLIFDRDTNRHVGRIGRSSLF